MSRAPYVDDADFRLYVGDALEVLRELPSESVHTIITSPPYWGLRSYLADGHDDKPHEMGLEPTPTQYVENMVAVFREAHRVLRRDGTCWLNIGDSMSVGTTLFDELQGLVKGAPVFCGNSTTVRVTSKRVDVSLDHDRPPNGELVSLLGLERVTLKKRNDDLGQVLHLFNGPAYARIGPPIRSMSRNATDLEIFLDTSDDIRVVITDLDTDVHPILGVSRIGGGSREEPDAAFAVEEPSEPMAERVRSGQPVGDALSGDAFRERLPDVHLVNQAVSLRDAFEATARSGSDLRVTSASEQHLSLSIGDRGWQLAFKGVGHLFIPDGAGWVRPYAQVYHEAIARRNERTAKQELGIPFLLRQALMRDGWMCRSTIIWSKPNPMPESVTDRPTKAHEYVFLLTRSARYFYDADAIREPYGDPAREWWNETTTTPANPNRNDGGGVQSRPARGPDGRRKTGVLAGDGSIQHRDGERWPNLAGRNRRSVWEVATEPYPDAHFATYPQALVEPCILAGTSERGCCPVCGAPWEREAERELVDVWHRNKRPTKAALDTEAQQGGDQASRRARLVHGAIKTTTTGWRPTCDHQHEPVPCTVLDIFLGSGTTALVARRLGRHAIGIELSREYADLAARRTRQLSLLA